jgi:hypothetical protein
MGGDMRGEVLARHAAGPLQDDGIDLTQPFGIKVVRAAIIVGGNGTPLGIGRVSRRYGYPPGRPGLHRRWQHAIRRDWRPTS